MAFGYMIDQRKQNKRNHVVELFRIHGVVSKARIRQLSGYSMDTLISLFKSLEDEGYIQPVKDSPEESAGRSKGRPAELYRLRAERDLYLGITFNQTGMWMTLVGLDGREQVSGFVELPVLGDQDAFCAFFSSKLGAFLKSNQERISAIRQIALSLPGRIRADTGILSRYNLLPYIRNLDLAPLVRSVTGDIPVTVQHNIAGLAAALIPELPEDAASSRILYVSARSGTAHALIQNGKLIIDDGEMGHMAVPGLERICQCGRQGCLDTVFSAAEFHRLFPGLGWAEIATAIARDDETGSDYKGKIIPAFEALVEVILNLSAALSPDCLVLSGELFGCIPDSREWIKSQIESRYRTDRTERIPAWVPGTIHYLPLGSDSAAIGLCRTLIQKEWAWQTD